MALACSGSAPSAAPAPTAPAITRAAPAASAHDRATDCAEKRELALELAKHGDQVFKIDVERAIADYRQAAELYPAEHHFLWKLALACDKTEDWGCMIEALTRASAVAPELANYWYKLGYAWVMLGDAGEAGAFERAKEPLERCIEADPNFAECHYRLGEAFQATDDEQSALAAFTTALERDPENSLFYLGLAGLYVRLGLHAQAKVVLKEATRLLPTDWRTRNHLCAMHVLSATIARFEGNQREMLRALEQAEKLANDLRPELAFDVGFFYATMAPPRKDPAVRLLNQFMKRVCRGSAARSFVEECDTAYALMERVGAR